MVRPKASKYDPYAQHRIIHQMMESYSRFGSWERLAMEITTDRGVRFHRTDFNRVRNGTAGEAILDNLVDWFVSRDPTFRQKLRPEGIFSEVGVSARDYYFHLYGMENLEVWDESLLQEFEGVYVCAPDGDAHSYLPSMRVRAELTGERDVPAEWRKRRGTDIRRYISQRSFLILKRTEAHYFHAAEIPMGALFPPEFQTLDVKSFYEGVGIASANTIHVFLRECMTRVPKIHSILLRDKASYQIPDANGIRMYHEPTLHYLPNEWGSLRGAELEQMQAEFYEPINMDVFLRGTSQINLSPLALTKNKVDTIFGTEQVYHRKPRQFLRDPETHFILPDLKIDPQLDKLIDNPLIIGELL